MRLNHNMSSLSIYNGYKKNLINNKSAIERLSTGIKINSAKDNPNKIGQSEQMRIQIKSLQAVQRKLVSRLQEIRLRNHPPAQARSLRAPAMPVIQPQSNPSGLTPKARS